MSEDKVSVIVPVYNSEAYLPMCIESIRRQSYQDIEILLIDDGSTDGSLRICREHAASDSRIRVIWQENRGVSAARNCGLESMSGAFFTFVDSDDILTENAIACLMQDLSNNCADLASGVKSMLLSDGTLRETDADHRLNVYSGRDMVRLSLEGDGQTNSVCAKLFRASMFRDIRFEEGRGIHEDGFFLFRCFTLEPKTVQHNESIYLYRVREGSNSRDAFSEKHYDMLYFCERKKQIVQQSFPELAGLLPAMEVRTHLAFLSVLCRTTDRRHRTAQKKSIQIVKQYYGAVPYLNQHHRRLAWIAAHGLYPFYRQAVYWKYYR